MGVRLVRRGAVVAAIAIVSLTSVLPARAIVPDPGGNSADLRTPAQLGKRFGVTSNVGGFASGMTAAQEADLIGRAGGTVHRFSLAWSEVQPTPGRPIITGPVTATSHYPPDRQYIEAVNRGQTPVVQVFDAPAWASYSPTSASCGFLSLNCILTGQQLPHQPPRPGHVQSYGQIVAGVALRYPQAMIETWNEPNESYWWGRRAPDPKLMADMQCAAYDWVKYFNPNQKVLSPAIGAARTTTSTRMSYTDYARGLYAGMGNRICWDILNIHLYSGWNVDGPDTILAEQMQLVRASKAARQDPSPIWVTETGLSTSLSQGSEDQQARVQIQGVHKLLTMNDIAAVLVMTLRDGGSISSYNHPNTPEYGYGMVSQALKAKRGYCHWVLLHGNSYTGC